MYNVPENIVFPSETVTCSRYSTESWLPHLSIRFYLLNPVRGLDNLDLRQALAIIPSVMEIC